MKLNKLFNLILLLVLSVVYNAQAQNETDVIRYTQFSNLTTARSVGLGGAMGALGADFSVMSTNPAGLAWYRKSVFEITPTMTNVEVNSLLTNEQSNNVWRETKYKFGLPNMGLVIAMHRPGSSQSTFNFGIGLNQLADFNRNFYFEGDSKGSIVNRFQELANGADALDNFESGVAFDADALIYDDGFYASDFDLSPDALINKEQIVQTTGSVKEVVVGMAGNFNEKVLFGLSLGFPLVSFTEEKTYREVDEGEGDVGNVPVFDALEYTESFNTQGGGVNLKMGVVFRVNQALRLGGAIHTPTLYDLTDKDYKTTMSYDYTLVDTQNNGYAESPVGSFIYALRTPWRFIGSGAYIIGKKGLISADLEYINYSKSELIFDEFQEEELVANQLVANNLTAALNFKVGGEVTMEMFRLRAGFELGQSPISGDDTVRTGYSFGGGVRGRSVFFDVAYKNTVSKETYIPYRTYEAPTQNVDNDNITGNVVATLGFRF